MQAVAAPAIGQQDVADLDLQSLEAARDIVAASVRHRVRALVIEVRQHAQRVAIGTPEQGMNRQATGFADQIVERHVHAGPRRPRAWHAAAVSRLHQMVAECEIARIAPLQRRAVAGDLGFHLLAGLAQIPLLARGLANAISAILGRRPSRGPTADAVARHTHPRPTPP